ncbi:hypothetical protein EOL96_02500 [Candidatus Saccharibacteria bacterium]|nr:hypothetical protein [Candidatus Saccharibacteria bacterium]
MNMANHKEMTFYHGTMGSRKSLELMLDQYRRQEKMHHNTLIIKPGLDDRTMDTIYTRAFGGEERAALILPTGAEAGHFINEAIHQKLGVRATQAAEWTIYADEINFFSQEQVASMRSEIVDNDIADVNMYGLLNDAFGNLFPGSAAALKYSDRIIQLDNICDNEGCDRTAIRNARILDNEIIYEGEQIAVDKPGAPYSYMALCHRDYSRGFVKPHLQ